MPVKARHRASCCPLPVRHGLLPCFPASSEAGKQPFRVGKRGLLPCFAGSREAGKQAFGTSLSKRDSHEL